MSWCNCVYFVSFFGSPAHFRSYYAETGNMTLANIGCYKLKALGQYVRCNLKDIFINNDSKLLFLYLNEQIIYSIEE
jgi:hypothetical protein